MRERILLKQNKTDDINISLPLEGKGNREAVDEVLKKGGHHVRCCGNKNQDQQYIGNKKSYGCHVYDILRKNAESQT